MAQKMKVCNVSEYNRLLKDRAKFFSLIEALKDQWKAPDIRCHGAKRLYSDPLIEVMLTIRYLYRLPLRQLQGFFEDVVKIMNLGFPVPNYSVVSRRAKALNIKIIDHRQPGDQSFEILIDSTGINIYSTQRHGKKYSSFRQHYHYEQVKKVHSVLDVQTGKVLETIITDGTVSDHMVVPELLDLLPSLAIKSLRADSAYDRHRVRKACAQRSIKQIIPPRQGAVKHTGNMNESPSLWEDRNRAIDIISQSPSREEGLEMWKKEVGYGRRSLIECHFYRLKTIFGGSFMSRDVESRVNEIRIKQKRLNAFNDMGRPTFQKVA